MGSATPKQFLPLQDRPVLMWTLDAFHAFDGNMDIVLVLPEAHVSTWEQLCTQHDFAVPHRVAHGGATRTASVRNGLELIDDADVVGVHDGVRPLVNHSTIERAYTTAFQEGAAVPVTPVVSSLRQITAGGNQSVDRSAYRIVQTPQCFRKEILIASYKQLVGHDFSDDATVVENGGHPIHLVEGNPENIKVTTPSDLQLAATLLNR